ncbi:MAG: sensor histidine kinase [Spirochaetales bacterium]|nr:sensor histidine kinase [Spirochaetales bacterium]
MLKPLLPHRFLIRIFLSLLLTGLVQVILLGTFTILFSTRLIEDTYRDQSAGRMELLVSKVNTIISAYRETELRLSRNTHILDSLFSTEEPAKEELSLLYHNLYKELSGRIDDASVHLVSAEGDRIYSTHVVPAIYNPNSSEQYLSTYLKLKQNRETFPMVDSFVSPKGDRVAISLFHLLESENGRKGYIITDLNTEPLGKALEINNAGFFTDIYLLDNINYKFVSLFREGVYGNFSELGWQVPKGDSGVFTKDGILVAYNSLYPEELTLAGTLRYGTVTTNLSFLTRMIFIISVVGLILSSLVAYALAKRITHPVTLLVGAMKKMETGDLSVQVEDFNEDEFEILFHGFNQMASRIKSLMEARVEKEKALSTAERHALQSQINPHFLYNTLNTVKAISKLHGVEDITTIITQLGKLLRDSIDSKEEFTTVRESLNLVEGYLQIQRIRYGSSFNWEIEVDQALNNIEIPRLIIQPIVENSVIHGLEKLTGKRNIQIKGRLDPPMVTVKDNGAGLTDEIWQSALNGQKGVGLQNVNRRLKLYYGDEAGLSYSREEDNSIVKIHLSWKKGESSES